MKSLGLLIIASVFWIPASADDLQLIINGKSFHLGGENLNESNYGIGLQYDFSERNQWVPVMTFASFKDSNNNTSRYIGFGSKRRHKLGTGRDRVNLDLGIIGLAMKRPGYNDGKPFFAALPFVSLSKAWGGINLTYAPKIEDNAYAFWYLQFSFKLANL